VEVSRAETSACFWHLFFRERIGPFIRASIFTKVYSVVERIHLFLSIDPIHLQRAMRE